MQSKLNSFFLAILTLSISLLPTTIALVIIKQVKLRSSYLGFKKDFFLDRNIKLANYSQKFRGKCNFSSLSNGRTS